MKAEPETVEKVPNLHGDQLQSHFSTAWRTVMKKYAPITVFFFFILLLGGAFFFRVDVSVIKENFLSTYSDATPSAPPLKCSNQTIENTCKVNDTLASDAHEVSNASCPEYFRWIHEDLRPWATSGISRETLESAQRFATFRLVIINGRLYYEKYQNSFQTRDLFTLWGIVQLLRLYPGKVPDLELMFQCGDMPEIQKGDYQGPNATWPPPSLFQYSGSDAAYAITFPDWSFWGWVEVNIKPWTITLKDIIKGSQRKQWKKREPYAYWRGNPYVSPNRGDLMKCKPSLIHDWNARLYTQDWVKEIDHGFKHSHLEDQCTHRYKIYIEGRAWSVSDKYIIACDSMTLLVKPDYYGFFLRALVPMKHYWPIRKTDKCRDIKFAVDWGNSHTDEAQSIGKGGSGFVKENLKMEYVYSYMFHVFREYAKLLKFKPEIPKGAVELCAESMACSESEEGLIRRFMEESMVISPSTKLPCAILPPHNSSTLEQLSQRKDNITRQVVTWENEHRHKSNKKKSKPDHS